jgi:hypothetical protein
MIASKLRKKPKKKGVHRGNTTVDAFILFPEPSLALERYVDEARHWARFKLRQSLCQYHFTFWRCYALFGYVL